MPTSRWRRSTSLLAAGLLAGSLATVVGPPPASAGLPPATAVTTTADTVNPSDGVLSLREAISLANTDGFLIGTTFQLQDGARYRLTRCGTTADEDANDTGDLDVLAAEESLLAGDATIEQTCPGQRVVEQKAPTGQLGVQEVTITGGNTEEDGGALLVAGDLYLAVDAELHHNRGSGGGAARVLGDTVLSGATVRDNVAHGGFGGGLLTEGANVVQGSALYRNVASSVGGAIASNGSLVVDRSTITQNEAISETSTGGGTSVAGTTTITTSTIVANRAVSAANVRSGGTTSVLSSIIALGSGGPDCDVPLPLGGGSGLIVGADASCGTPGPQDVAGAHPMLAPLARVAAHATTASRAPVAPSVAVDLDPAPCAGGSADQHDHERPVGGACDSGAFEGAPPPCTPSFPDVPGSHPFFADVCWLDQMGITGGFTDGTFKPGQAVSRQAMAAFLYRFALAPGFTPPTDDPSFVDVGASHPFFREIEWLVSTGIATGYEDDTYRPLTAVSRQAMAAFLYRVHDSPLFIPVTPSFTDVAPFSTFYLAIEWLVANGVADGYGDGTYRPSAPVSRQAMAAFLLRVGDAGLIDGL
jgi:CSLREA domain-containing protein